MDEDRCTCSEDHEDLLPCPYQEDINDNYDDVCACCAYCQQQCAMDI